MREINLKEKDMNKLKAIRHGENLLLPVNKTVKGEKHKKFIVGHSETGHHHVLESKQSFTVSQNDKEFLIELFAPGKLKHQKTVNRHKDLVVPAGTYKVIRKTEYDPFEKIRREVWD